MRLVAMCRRSPSTKKQERCSQERKTILGTWNILREMLYGDYFL